MARPDSQLFRVFFGASIHKISPDFMILQLIFLGYWRVSPTASIKQLAFACERGQRISS
jgi:hypothetical protein